MATQPHYMIDTSATHRSHLPLVGARLLPLARTGLVATCGSLELEYLYSSRNSRDYATRRTERALLRYLPTEETDWQSALHVQYELARRSQLRGIGVPDLIVSAVARRYKLTLLHYDADFDRIAGITGQTVAWVVPRGTVP